MTIKSDAGTHSNHDRHDHIERYLLDLSARAEALAVEQPQAMRSRTDSSNTRMISAIAASMLLLAGAGVAVVTGVVGGAARPGADRATVSVQPAEESAPESALSSALSSAPSPTQIERHELSHAVVNGTEFALLVLDGKQPDGTTSVTTTATIDLNSSRERLYLRGEVGRPPEVVSLLVHDGNAPSYEIASVNLDETDQHAAAASVRRIEGTDETTYDFAPPGYPFSVRVQAGSNPEVATTTYVDGDLTGVTVTQGRWLPAGSPLLRALSPSHGAPTPELWRVIEGGANWLIGLARDSSGTRWTSVVGVRGEVAAAVDVPDGSGLDAAALFQRLQPAR